jgi:hypothetical protein
MAGAVLGRKLQGNPGLKSGGMVTQPYRQKTLEEMRNQISFARPHPKDNTILISQTLRMISSRFGVEEANRAIVDFDLERLGWEQQAGEESEKMKPISPRDLMDPITRVLSED